MNRTEGHSSVSQRDRKVNESPGGMTSSCGWAPCARARRTFLLDQPKWETGAATPVRRVTPHAKLRTLSASVRRVPGSSARNAEMGGKTGSSLVGRWTSHTNDPTRPPPGCLPACTPTALAPAGKRATLHRLLTSRRLTNVVPATAHPARPGSPRLAAVVVLVGRQPMARSSSHPLRRHGQQVQQDLALVGLGPGQREQDREAVQGTDQVQPQPQNQREWLAQ